MRRTFAERERGSAGAGRARAAAAALAAVALAAIGGDALAQRKRPPAPPAVDAKGMAQKIRSGDPARALEGIAAARDAGAAAAGAAPAIEELLARGATVPVTKAAIEALGAIGQGTSSAALRPYARHRLAEVRRGAFKALSATKGPDAIAAFEEGLRSGDAVVRGYSASGLGDLGVTRALPDLFAALDREVTEAAAAIGQLCDPAACERFVDRLGKVAFDVMTSGIDPMLFRGQALPDELLVGVIDRVRDLGTPEAGKFLADVQARWPATGSPAVKRALDGAVRP